MLEREIKENKQEKKELTQTQPLKKKLHTQINFNNNAEGAVASDDVRHMQDELNKLRTESK